MPGAASARGRGGEAKKAKHAATGAQGASPVHTLVQRPECTGGRGALGFFLSTSLSFHRASACISHSTCSRLPSSAGNCGFCHNEGEDEELGGDREAVELGWRSRDRTTRLSDQERCGGIISIPGKGMVPFSCAPGSKCLAIPPSPSLLFQHLAHANHVGKRRPFYWVSPVLAVPGSCQVSV